jgi:hypothetical protein
VIFVEALMKIAFLEKIAILAFAFSAVPIAAQDYAFQGFAGDMAMNQMMGANLEAQLGIQDQQSSPIQKQQGLAVSASALNYKISMQRRKSNYASFIQKSYAMSPAAGQEVEGLLRKMDPIQKVSADLQRVFGMRVDNVADAYALWMTGAWFAVNAPDTDLTRTQFQAVRGQVADAFTATSGMAEANDEIKQNMAEAMILNILIIDSTIEGLKNDPAKRAQLQSSIYKNTKRDMGIDLKAITLTDAGFVLRKSGKPR